MRLWHKDLIEVLPRQQLVSQWRECCCIAKNWADNGTPNHILVNKVIDYPVSHFDCYTKKVIKEMKKRGYKISETAMHKYEFNLECIYENAFDHPRTVVNRDLFLGWHNDHYLKQCYYNLQEKFDCDGIAKDEWSLIAITFWNTVYLKDKDSNKKDISE